MICHNSLKSILKLDIKLRDKLESKSIGELRNILEQLAVSSSNSYLQKFIEILNKKKYLKKDFNNKRLFRVNPVKCWFVYNSN